MIMNVSKNSLDEANLNCFQERLDFHCHVLASNEWNEVLVDPPSAYMKQLVRETHAMHRALDPVLPQIQVGR